MAFPEPQSESPSAPVKERKGAKEERVMRSLSEINIVAEDGNAISGPIS
jgi:hypothetical protein